MQADEYITIPKLAKILGISRIAVYKKVKKGQIEAIRIGKNYTIHRRIIAGILGEELREEDRRKIEEAVRRTVKEYGQVLVMLGRE